MGGTDIPRTPYAIIVIYFSYPKAIITKYTVALILNISLLDQLRVRKIKHCILFPFFPSLTHLRQIYCADALSFLFVSESLYFSFTFER